MKFYTKWMEPDDLSMGFVALPFYIAWGFNSYTHMKMFQFTIFNLGLVFEWPLKDGKHK